MIFLFTAAMACGLVRFAAPHIRDIVASRELAKPGMTYTTAVKAIDGVWSTKEIPEVLDALKFIGSDEILRIGRERVEALRRGGCPVCSNPNCRKLFPIEVPERCDRCGYKIGDKKKEPTAGT